MKSDNVGPGECIRGEWSRVRRKLNKRRKARGERRKAKANPECFATYDKHHYWST